MSREPRPRPRGAERGFALVAVLLVLALLSVIGTEFAYSMRLEATMVRSYKEHVIAMHLAEAAVEQAVREILTDASLVGYPEDGPLTFYRTPLEPLPRLPRDGVRLGAGEFSYRITDEEARIDLNRSTADRLDRLLAALELDKSVRDTIVDSIEDWRDANEEHRANGAESEDTYLKLPVPYRARNANFDDIRELLQVHGLTPEIYHGHDGHPGLVEFVTVASTGQVNINTAPAAVLQALGLADAEIIDIVQSRRTSPYATVPGRFTARGFGAASRTFRIDAEGRVDGRPRARVMAIVQKRSGRSGEPEVAFLAWDRNVDAAVALPMR
jgi:type II secretory pathway component PulK